MSNKKTVFRPYLSVFAMSLTELCKKVNDSLLEINEISFNSGSFYALCRERGDESKLYRAYQRPDHKNVLNDINAREGEVKGVIHFDGNVKGLVVEFDKKTLEKAEVELEKERLALIEKEEKEAKEREIAEVEKEKEDIENKLKELKA